MDALDAAILGAVQGIGEFLPISSSAHLSFAQQLLKLPRELPLIVLLHLPTLLCILLFYPKEAFRLFSDRRREFFLLIVATVPAAVAGYFLRDVVSTAFESNIFAGVGLLFTAVALLTAYFLGGGQTSVQDTTPLRCASRLTTNERRFAAAPWHTTNEMGAGAALLIGLMQVGASMPGVSRLGMCLSACLLLRMEVREAVRFSVFLSVPLTLGAATLKASQIVELCAETKPIMIVAAAGSAFVLGICGLWLLQKLCVHKKLWVVAVYCALASGTVLFLALG